jgi:hypothetical protein
MSSSSQLYINHDIGSSDDGLSSLLPVCYGSFSECGNKPMAPNKCNPVRCAIGCKDYTTWSWDKDGDKCALGPDYWCESSEQFKECIQSNGFNGTREQFPSCKKLLSSPAPAPEAPEAPETPPSNCAQGPNYWCSSDANFEECNRIDGKTRATYSACNL